MKLRTGTVALMLLVFSNPAKAEDELKFIAFMRGEITVGADGRAKAVSFHDIKDATYEKYFTETVKSWAFHPVSLNGNPVEATTNFSFDVTATYSADKTLKHLDFANIIFQESAIEAEFKKSHDLPSAKPAMRCRLPYPLNALRAGAGAKLKVAANLGQDGKVKDTTLISAAVTNTHPRDAKSFANTFAAGSLKCFKQYEFTEAEFSGLQCQNGCVVSLTAEFVRSDFVGKWQNYHTVPVAPVPWVVAAELKDMDSLEQSQLVRLKQDPTGQPLEIGG